MQCFEVWSPNRCSNWQRKPLGTGGANRSDFALGGRCLAITADTSTLEPDNQPRRKATHATAGKVLRTNMQYVDLAAHCQPAIQPDVHAAAKCEREGTEITAELLICTGKAALGSAEQRAGKRL